MFQIIKTHSVIIYICIFGYYNPNVWLHIYIVRFIHWGMQIQI